MRTMFFITNIVNNKHLQKVATLIQNISGVRNWQLDLQHSDKVLQVEAEDLTPYDIATRVQLAGYYCVEKE